MRCFHTLVFTIFLRTSDRKHRDSRARTIYKLVLFYIEHQKQENTQRTCKHILTMSAFSEATASSFSFTANSLESWATDSLASISLANPVFILLASSPICSRFSVYIAL